MRCCVSGGSSRKPGLVAQRLLLLRGTQVAVLIHPLGQMLVALAALARTRGRALTSTLAAGILAHNRRRRNLTLRIALRTALLRNALCAALRIPLLPPLLLRVLPLHTESLSAVRHVAHLGLCRCTRAGQ